ncbi:MAG: D-amino acid dehydrogenase [Pseudomonadales bacterium]
MHVLVIGAGVQGISNAYFLNRAGHEVTVVDSATTAAMECSYANGGGLTPSAAAPWNDPGVYKTLIKYIGRKDAPMMFRMRALPSLVGWGLRFLSYAKESVFLENTLHSTRLCNYSMTMMREIEQETGIDYRATDSGLLMIFRDEESQQGLEAFYNLLTEVDVHYDSLSVEQTIKQEPALQPIKDQLTGGMFCPADRSGDSHLFCKNMANFTAQRGVIYQYNTKITSLRQNGSLFEATSENGNALKADAVVIAAGCYSPQLGKQLGIKIPIKPAKGYSLTIPIDEWQQKPKTLVADMSLHAGLNPLNGEVLRVAGTAEFAGFDTKLTPERIDNLTGLVEAVYPELAASMDRETLNPWAGLRPMSVDSVGIVGGTSVKNLYVSAGQGHLGWTTAAGSGRIIADLLSGDTPEIDVQAYSINRF